MKKAWIDLLKTIEEQWVLLFLWLALLTLNVAFHGIEFSTDFELADSSRKYQSTSALILYLCTALFCVRLMQGGAGETGLGFQRPISSTLRTASKFIVVVLMFLVATLLPYVVDFVLFRASAGPIWATIQAQVAQTAVPFLFCLWLATVTRNLKWFFLGVLIAAPLVWFLTSWWMANDDPADPKDAVPAEKYLAFWICVIGLGFAIVWRYFRSSLVLGRRIGIITLAVAFFVGLIWWDPLTVLLRPQYPSAPAINLPLPPDYFGAITWEAGDYVFLSNIACLKLNHVLESDHRFPVIEFIQAKFVLPDGKEYQLRSPQIPKYLERTAAKVLASRYDNLASANNDPPVFIPFDYSNKEFVQKQRYLARHNFSMQLFGFDPAKDELPEGQPGKVVLDITGRMVELTKIGDLPVSHRGRLSFPDGIVLVDLKLGEYIPPGFTTVVNVRAFSYDPSGWSQGSLQFGGNSLVYVLSDFARNHASVYVGHLDFEKFIKDPWCVTSSSSAWRILPPGSKAADADTTPFSEPLDDMMLSIYKAQKRETFRTTVVVPSLTLPNWYVGRSMSPVPPNSTFDVK